MNALALDPDDVLYDRLGLKRYRLGLFGSTSSGWNDCGTVELDSATVRVEVSAYPAEFFRFTITPKVEDVTPAVLETGSGTLSDYWPSVELWASGLLQKSEGQS